MEPTYGISDISAKTGLSYDTIRYYEKIGLLPRPRRRENGQRAFDQLDLERFIFIVHLKRTNMPLKEIQRYMDLIDVQDFDSCYAILTEHKQNVIQQIQESNETLDVLNHKLDNFHLLTSAAIWGSVQNEANELNESTMVNSRPRTDLRREEGR
ncbi:MerR family transcriptional regulator [Paenibacillus sp. GCM10023250]|uniref:MerR family transcriptional regulator n=1 Tax=Paenibacillus sp. GCM10023250 TaxID=3252648 RepID=UPI00360CBB4E